jgi:hypothetical protein
VIGADGIETKKPASLVAAILSWLPLGESAASRTDRKPEAVGSMRIEAKT